MFGLERVVQRNRAICFMEGKEMEEKVVSPLVRVFGFNVTEVNGMNFVFLHCDM